jgi:hypothetical protein
VNPRGRRRRAGDKGCHAVILAVLDTAPTPTASEIRVALASVVRDFTMLRERLVSTAMFATKYYVPGLNMALIVSFVVTVGRTLFVIPYGKRRKPGTPVTWGEAMLAATYVFGVLFLAYGVVPHQWLTHAGNELGWRTDKILIGPKIGPRHLLKYFPFTITAAALQDTIAVVIYGFFLGLQIAMWSWWQRRGKKPSVEVATSTYGRPLVKKA